MTRGASGWRPVRLVLIVLVCLVAAEVALRVSRFGLSSAALGRWQRRTPWEEIRTLNDGGPWPRPDGAARWPLQAGSPTIAYRLDRDGFRVPAKGSPSRRAACGVLVVGDSNAFGYGVPAEEAFPAQLETILRARGAEVVVQNAGICGSDVAQQRRWLDDVLARTTPDVVVFTVSPWSLRTDHPPHPPAGGTVGDKLWNVVSGRTATLASWSAVADRLRRRTLHTLADLVGWPPPSLVAWELEPLTEPRASFEARFAGAAMEVQGAVERLRGTEASPILLLVPLDVQVSRARNRLYSGERLPYPAWGFQDRDYARDARHSEALTRLARALGVPVVDAAGALARQAAESYLEDDYHLSAGGHRRIAEEIASAVRGACDRIVVASSPVGETS